MLSQMAKVVEQWTATQVVGSVPDLYGYILCDKNTLHFK